MRVLSFIHHSLRTIAVLLCVTLTVHASSYVIGAGDELFVDFPLRGSPTDLQPLGGNGLTLIIVGESVFFRYTATVAPDGFITLPAMDPLHISGLTIEEVRNQINRRFKSFSLRDTVSVILSRPNSQAFIVTGQVNHPGRFIYERPTSIMEAVALAGGPTDHAQMKRVLLLREGRTPLSIDLTDKRLQDYGVPTDRVLPADSIVVPRRWFTPDSVLVLIFLSCVTTAATVYAATRY